MIDHAPATEATRFMPPQTPTETPPHRWWEYARRGAIHCGPHPLGHHIPNTFHVNESGFIRCEKKVPNVSAELRPIVELNQRRMFREANQLRLVLEQRGVVLPTPADLLEMGKYGTVPCDRWVFLYAIRGGGIVTAEVSLDDKQLMENLSTPTEMIDYLGILGRKAG